MSLFRVTITGADDAVNPRDLGRLSLDFPFVEWGVLVSEKRAGTPRYPSRAWIRDLLTWPGTIAAHLCGADARTVADGRDHWILEHSIRLRRIQINGFDAPIAPRLVALARHHYTGVILQCRDAESLPDVARAAALLPRGRGFVLFDPSGGRGVAPDAWPDTPPGCQLGFAGGIRPDNVVDVLLALGRRAPFWIDLESGARDQHDAFDLARVRWILEKAAPFVGRGSK